MNMDKLQVRHKLGAFSGEWGVLQLEGQMSLGFLPHYFQSMMRHNIFLEVLKKWEAIE